MAAYDESTTPSEEPEGPEEAGWEQVSEAEIPSAESPNPNNRPQHSESRWLLYALLTVTGLSIAGNLWLVVPMINFEESKVAFKGEQLAWQNEEANRIKERQGQLTNLQELKSRKESLEKEIAPLDARTQKLQAKVDELDSVHKQYEVEQARISSLKIEMVGLKADEKALKGVNQILIERTKNIDDLKDVSAQLDSAKTMLEQNNKDLKTAKDELDKARAEDTRLRDIKEDLELQIKSDSAKAQAAAQALSTATDDLANEKAKLEQVEQNKRAAQIRVDASKGESELLKAKRASLNSEIKIAEANAKTSTDALSEAEDALVKEKAEVKRVEQKVRDAQKRLNGIEELRAGLAITVSGLKSELARLNAEVNQKRKNQTSPKPETTPPATKPTPAPSPDDSSPNTDTKAPQ